MSLKDELDQFGELFKRHLNGTMKATLRWVVADSIDWEGQTMTATDSDGLEYFDVVLGVGSTVSKPVKGTDCLIAIVEGDEATAFMFYAEEVELLQLNGGENGGLTITPTLVQELNKNNQVLQAILSVLTGTPITEPGNGSPSALQTALSTALSGKELGDFSKIENEKITH